MRRRTIIIAGLEFYALLLAALQFAVGVRTDEAKYLLDIPYPHPPLMRWLLSLTLAIPFHELLWRLLFATLVVQAVWLLLYAFSARRLIERSLIAASWLLSVGVMMQAGMIMMAPLTAVTGLVFLCLLSHRPRAMNDESLGFVLALLWFMSLFTAYQAILFLPLVYGVYAALRIRMCEKWLYIVLPILLLCVYTLTNPLALAGMLLVSGQGMRASLAAGLKSAAMIWLVGGSIIFSVVGTFGIVKSRWEIWLSFVLLCLYVFLSPQGYYGILFVPFFSVGTAAVVPHLHRLKPRFRFAAATILLAIVALASVTIMSRSIAGMSVARDTMVAVAAALPSNFPRNQGRMLIVGSFGHEWQYYSPLPVFRFTSSFTNEQSDVLVCLQNCPRRLKRGMCRLTGASIETYVQCSFLSQKIVW